MKLRPYQQDAVNAIYSHIREREDNPCVVIPTAGGKTPVMAHICKDVIEKWKGRVLILAHVKELLQQTVESLNEVAPDLWNRIGVYSAGLNSRSTQQPIIVAGIQSVYKKADELGWFDIIMIDEAHMIPPDGEGRYRVFLHDAMVVNPNVRLIGLTATPYRTKGGWICKEENLLNHICYEIGVKELIIQKFICPMISKGGKKKLDTSNLHIRAGEFMSNEVEDLMDTDELVISACQDIVGNTQDRKSVLIFSSSVMHGAHIQTALKKMMPSEKVESVFGITSDEDRARIIKEFKAGEIKYLINMGVFTMGFNAPIIDCIAMVRPTASAGLYYQMVGRGFRINPLKEDCLVLDFGGNIVRHGPVDDIQVKKQTDGTGDAPAKECPNCHTIVAAAYAICPGCGYKFPDKKQEHDAEASTASIISKVKNESYRVDETNYSIHKKYGAMNGAPTTMRVDYSVGWYQQKSEWICFDHTGYARQKAVSWWRLRSESMIPESTEMAVFLAQEGALAETKFITVRTVRGERYDRIIDHELGPKPDWKDDV